MPESIHNGWGDGQHPWKITPSGAGLVQVTGSIVIGSVSAHVESIFVQSGNAPFGYVNNQIIRKNSGSPAVNYVFGEKAAALSIENLGSTPAYFKFDGTADTGSNSGFLSAYTFRSFDAQVGSVSFLGSGAGSPSIQCVRLN